MSGQESQQRRESRLPAYLTALAAFIAAMMPLTAFINGRYSIEVEREKFLKQLHLNYIDRALDTSRDPLYRESFLRFIIDTTRASDSLNQWARREIAKASELAKLRTELAVLDSLQKTTAAQLATERGLRSRDKSALAVREQELKRIEKDRARLVLALHEAELRSGAVAIGPPATPRVSSVKVLLIGTDGTADILISGEHFGNVPGTLFIIHEDKSTTHITPYSWSDRAVRFILPANLPPYTSISLNSSDGNIIMPLLFCIQSQSSTPAR